MKLTAQEIAQATHGRWSPEKSEAELVIESLSTDTRKLQKGDLFVALKGERFDAHDHLDQALRQGAGALVIRESFNANGFQNQVPILKVPDTLKALGDIAAAWRAKCSARRVAIVGSSGKTTTKEMLAAILQSAAPTLSSAGNFNNLIGVPLTLFGLQPDHRWAVIELGMNLPGELARLTEIADPDLLLLVNVGTAHIGQFGSHEALLEAKGEAVRALRAGVPILYNRACENSRRIVEKWGSDHPLLTFAVNQTAEVQGRNIMPHPPKGYGFQLQIGSRLDKVNLPVFGRYNVANAVAAAAAAHALGIGPSQIALALASFQPAAMRSEVRSIGGVTCIVDCYNANPDSMSAALQSLSDWPQETGRTFLVLGDMLELGNESQALHRHIGREAAGMAVDGLLLLGNDTPVMLDEWRGATEAARHFPNHETLARHLVELVRPGDRVFFKGSRGNKLELIIQYLEQRITQNESQKE